MGAIPRPELDSNCDEYETIWAEIENSGDKNILICCAYRHPSNEISHFTEHLQMTLSNPSVENKYVFILGVFNINLINYDSHSATNDFISLLLSHHYLPYILHPTRVSDHFSTIIDNIFSNVCDLDTKSGNILTQIADHFPQFLIVKKVASSNRNMSYYQHDYTKFDQESFLADFNNLNFDYLNDNQSDINLKFNKFLVTLESIVEKHAPLKKLTKKDIRLQNKPWINSKIRKMMKFRDKLLKKLKKKPDPVVSLAYKQFRNRVACEL